MRRSGVRLPKAAPPNLQVRKRVDLRSRSTPSGARNLSWNPGVAKVYVAAMSAGHVEVLKRGFRAVVYAGKDPITGRKVYLKETHPDRPAAERARDRLIAQVDAERIPDQAATVAYLLDRWVEAVDHELSTRETNEGYIRRTLKPALGDMPLRKLQHRVDILDRLYPRLRRCNALCDGRPSIDHRRADSAHDCASVRC